MTEAIVRLVVVGSPQKWRGDWPISPNYDLASKMLEQVVDDDWPASRVLFAVTPGGFIQARMPEDYDGRRSWASRPDDFRSLIPAAEEAVWKVIDDDIRAKLATRARFLTVGVDLVPRGQSKTAGGPDTRAELVGVVDLEEGVVVRWTGKSYPQSGGDEERVLVQEPCLESHLLHVAGQRVLLLGCHDLNMFHPRSQSNAKDERARRWRKMDDLARRFHPTIALAHPHQTDASTTWQQGWSGLRPFLNGPYASGIAYYPRYPHYRKVRCPLENILQETKSDDVIDIRVNGYWSRAWEPY